MLDAYQDQLLELEHCTIKIYLYNIILMETILRINRL